MNENYRKQVALLVRILPLVYRIKDFAVHGGTAINLFVLNMPRYSVDIDITYLPLEDRKESLEHINGHLSTLKGLIEKTIPGIRVIHKTDVLKLLCKQGSVTVKIEVNGIKRGIIGETEDLELCTKAQEEFQTSFKIQAVPEKLLYGGKVAAALSRQHPRDLFDCRHMKLDFGEIKKDFLYCLLGSDKPLVESLNPNPVDQQEALENQFEGMADETFKYEDYKQAREELIRKVNDALDREDRDFLLSFEKGEPDWSKCCAGDLSRFPSVKWKLKNITALKQGNPDKFRAGVEKLESFLFPDGKDRQDR